MGQALNMHQKREIGRGQRVDRRDMKIEEDDNVPFARHWVVFFNIRSDVVVLPDDLGLRSSSRA